MVDIEEKLVDTLNAAITPIDAKAYDKVINKIGDARIVLIGEATHGTKEFYEARIEITKKLIEQKGFQAVAIEADWPDAYRIHRYVQGKGSADDAITPLQDFKRFPTWMWRNESIANFIKWLRRYNDQQAELKKIGFYGIDLYSLHSSMMAVIEYLKKVDPHAADLAKKRYACFDQFSKDPQRYGFYATQSVQDACIEETMAQLKDMQLHFIEYAKQDGLYALDEYFYALQNARLVKNAERYYRSMFEDHTSSWNIRDTHMVETLNHLADHLKKRSGKPAKIVVWAHNSHLGNASANEMSQQGEINVGQLIKEQYRDDCYAIGFSTYEGTVLAASEWGAPVQVKQVVKGMQGSYEELFHLVDQKNFILDLKNRDIVHYLQIPRLQRAIGVIYSPDTERYSHYFFTRLPYQFDAMIHMDKTQALKPID